MHAKHNVIIMGTDVSFEQTFPSRSGYDVGWSKYISGRSAAREDVLWHEPLTIPGVDLLVLVQSTASLKSKEAQFTNGKQYKSFIT